MSMWIFYGWSKRNCSYSTSFVSSSIHLQDLTKNDFRVATMFYTFTDQNGQCHSIDMDDKRFRIRPYQQMLSSCTGALLTSMLSEYDQTGNNRKLSKELPFYTSVTPLDVVKTRLQAQQKRQTSNRCFVYCNGLMEHLCPCPNSTVVKNSTLHYTGMVVSLFANYDSL